MNQFRLTPEEIAALVFHLPDGSDEPVTCSDPESCPLSPHAKGFEEAGKLVARRASARRWVWQSFTKADLSVLREEGW